MPKSPPKDKSIKNDFLGCNTPIIKRLTNVIKTYVTINVLKNINISESVWFVIKGSKKDLNIVKDFFIV